MEAFIQALGNIFTVSMTRYFIIAGVAFILVYLLFRNKLKSSKIQSKYANKKDFLSEIMHSTISTFFMSILAVTILFTPVREYTLLYKDFGDFPLWWLPVSVVLSLVIHDTYFYWLHRLLHHKRIFKYTHLVHHKSTNPSPWTSYSFHSLEAIAEGFIIVILAFILPMHPLMLVTFTIISFIINVYGHLGYEIMPKGLRNSPIFGIINTSVHHNLHHSKFKGNYGLYFRWWDRMMKTEFKDYVKEYDRIQEQRFGTKKEQQTTPINIRQAS